MTPTPGFLRRLSFGTTLGASIGGLLYSLNPEWFTDFTFGNLVNAGAIVGLLVSQLIDAWFRAFLQPILRSARYYLKLLELTQAREFGSIRAEQAEVILEELHKQYFLGESRDRKG